MAKLQRVGYVDHFESIRVRKDGQEIHVSLTISPVRDSQGNVTGAATIARDISDRTLVEKKLQDSLTKLDAAQEVAKIGFWNVDLTTGVLEWSNGVKSIFGLSPDDSTPTFDAFWGYVL